METDLHYNHYRYYDPISAKYLSKDPIGLIGGMNNSVYVSDPNQWVDPMGLVADREIKRRLQQNEECRRTGQCEALFVLVQIGSDIDLEKEKVTRFDKGVEILIKQR